MPDPRATHRAPKMWPLAWIAALAGGAAIALSLVAHRVPYFAADLAITRSVQATDYGPLAGPMHALNLLGFAPVVAWVYGGLILAIFFAGRRWAATMCGLTVLGGAGINFIAKALVDRPRPPAELIHVERQIASGSFPAGHVLNFTAFAGFLGYVAWMALPPSWPRHALVPIVSAPILLMGVARIASGQHWPSDVLGGYLMGSAWLRGLENVCFRDAVQLEDVAAILPLALASVVSVRDVPVARGARPSKLFPAWAAGCAVVYVGPGEGAELVREAEAGLVVDDADPVAIARALQDLVADPTLAKRLGQNGRTFVEQRFSSEKLVTGWLIDLQRRLTEDSYAAARRRQGRASGRRTGYSEPPVDPRV